MTTVPLQTVAPDVLADRTVDAYELEEDADHFYYFAYGSNLLQERLHILNPSATYVCNGALVGFRLGFGGYGKTWFGSAATIFNDPDHVVCGVVWKIGREHSSTLDEQERGYHRLYVDVKILPLGDENVAFTNGHTAHYKAIRCRTYQMILDHSGHSQEKPLPSPQYMRVILTGSKMHKLPLDYHKQLEAIEHNGYAGPMIIPICQDEA